jgi:hypothetical protein
MIRSDVSKCADRREVDDHVGVGIGEHRVEIVVDVGDADAGGDALVTP